MDEAPNSRPGWLPALATGGALLLVLAMLFGPAFSNEQILRTEGRTIGEWDQHFAGGAWDGQAGLGEPRQASPGFTSLFQTFCGISPDPAANFANYYPLACLFLLGMAAWLCFRQLDCSGLVCGIGALAAALNGVFFSRALEFSGDYAIAGAGMFVALVMILRPRFDWPHGLIAGLALGVGILETGSHGIAPSLAVGGIALAVLLADAKNRFTPCRLIALVVMALGAVAVGWPMLAHSPPAGADLDLFDLLTLPVAGLFGHRADLADNTQHWGALAGSHYHMYAGALVLLGAAWALMNAARKKSSFSDSDKYRVFLFFGVAGVSLLAMLGVVSGGSLLILFSVALLVVFALGLKGLDEWLASKAHEKTRTFGSGGFNLAWRISLFVLLVLATVAFTLYNNREEGLVAWLLKQSPGALPDDVKSLVLTSIVQVGTFTGFLFLSVVALTVCSIVKWKHVPRTAGLLALGLLLALDLGLAGAPFLRFDTLSEHYQPNPLAENLQRRATAGRVALLNDYRPLGKLPLDQLVMETSIARRQQLLAHEKIAALGQAWHQDWSRHIFPKLGIARARLGDYPPPSIDEANPQARAEAIRLLIRQWELSSTRFFLCHAGNQSLSKQVRAEYSDLPLPTYRNALNKTLDPILRRFQFVASFNLDASAPEDSATNGRPIVLMEFLGALPRASLLADWQSGINETNAAQILYRPGFDPHTRVLLRQANVPEPEQPSQTWNLPKVEFVDANATRVELKIPPTDFGTVLLLNDRHDPNWTVTLDGQQAPLLRANNHARAVHLPASDANRTLVFAYQPPAAHATSTTAALIIGLVAAGFGAWRQRSENDDAPGESEAEAGESGEDSEPDEA